MLKYRVMTSLKKITAFFNEKSWKSKTLIILLLSSPVILYGYGLLRTGSMLLPGDGDYYIQLYEASRISLLDYGQIPWWNPWVSGGVPLFANPQFGPISIQMIFSLLFGSVFGYKLALISYLLIGYWGFRQLCILFFESEAVKASLLGYIWIFSTFFTYRIAGHFTFFVVGFTPWMMYFLLTIHKKRHWLWLSLFSSAIIWSSMHYTTILSFVLLGFVFAWQLIKTALDLRSKKQKNKNIKSVMLYFYENLHIKRLLMAGVLTFLICLPRIYMTLEYSHDYPRTLSSVKESSIGLYNTAYAMFGINQFASPPINGDWGWHEISTYIGILTLPVFLISFYFYIKNKKQRADPKGWLLLGLISICLIISFGDFSSWAPYSILRDLPFFSSMRVSTRWINWASIFVLVFISYTKIKNKRVSYLVITALAITVIELFLTGFPRLNDTYIIPSASIRESGAPFMQRIYWNNKRFGVPYDENFTEATRNNVGQVYAGDSLIDTRLNAGALPTVRCDEINDGCDFLSNNAELVYWSPNKITIKRKSPGPIYININPGANWSINGSKDLKLKVVEPSKMFEIIDEAENIEIEYIPNFNLVGKIFNR